MAHFKNTTVKTFIILLTILFWGCSARQEQNNEDIFSETVENKMSVTSKPLLTDSMFCDHNELSGQFDITVNFKRYTDTIEKQDSSFLTLYIKDKNSKSVIDSVNIISLSYYSFMFTSCDSVTSYSTKFKADREIADNYFGDIVVADLNFDGKDDIAVINDGGGNSGPLYGFYTQTSNKRFVIDRFLTDSVAHFPDRIQKSKRRLITLGRAGACCAGEHIYQLDKTTNQWKHISYKVYGQPAE